MQTKMACRTAATRSLIVIAVCAGLLAARGQAAVVVDAPQTFTPTTRKFSGMDRTSVYIPMPDGVRLAADVYLPRGLRPGERTATVVQFTRYYRSFGVRRLLRPLAFTSAVPATERDIRDHLVNAGYSWVDVDVRGSGASFGVTTFPFAPREVGDGRYVLDWIVRQPWSAGVVATAGSSYNATLATSQLAVEHPALKAVVTNFGFWDLYDDTFATGGLHNSLLISTLGRLIKAFDTNSHSDLLGFMSGIVSGGVHPVDGSLLDDAQALRGKNIDLERLLPTIWYKDATDSEVEGELRTFADIDPSAFVGRRSRVPVLTYTGWLDGAMGRGAIRQFVATRAPGARLRIGPWFHAGEFNASPYASRSVDNKDRKKEVLRFLDQHLRGIRTGMPDEPAVHYFVMGAEEWRTSDTWPPTGGKAQTWLLGADRRLQPATSSQGEKFDRYTVDPSVTTGGSRFGFVIGSNRIRRYGDRRAMSGRALHYTTEPLKEPLTFIGSPMVELFVSSSASDGGLFVYLEDVAPDGYVRYVTEGQLRLQLRAWSGTWDLFSLAPLRRYLSTDVKPMLPGVVESVVLDLLPTAYQLPAGHALRLAITGADAGVFATPVTPHPLVYDVHRDRLHGSRLALPVYPGPPKTPAR
jgi:putative CocE/NonD family hydrolase